MANNQSADRRQSLTLLAMAMTIGLAMPAQAKLDKPGVVIYDSGNAYPMSQWVDDDLLEDTRTEQTPEQMARAVEMALDSFKTDDAQLPQIFPVEPKIIRPITLPGSKMLKDLPTLPQPMFVIGDDDYSLQWFEANREILMQYGAVGMLTHVDSRETWEQLQRLVAPLQLYPLNADMLAQEFGVPGYPIMVTRAGFFQ